MRTLVHSLFSALLALLLACANGGSGSEAPGDDGGASGDATHPGDGGPGGSGDGASPTDGAGEPTADAEGSGTSPQKACADSASAYCTQLETCDQYLVTLQYGDVATCVTAETPACLDALAATGTGWSGDLLEACVAARTKLDCNAFLHGKPAPQPCLVTGLLATGGACRYGAQCGTGYCRSPSSNACGTCEALGETGAPCTVTADCDGNLECTAPTAGTCQPPASAASPCSATLPCVGGLDCIAGVCTAPGELGATCSAAAGATPCDASQGLYCNATSKTCTEYTLAQVGGACGGPTAVCTVSTTCFDSLCVSPAQDGASCNTAQGLNCMPPDTCIAGKCSRVTASECK